MFTNVGWSELLVLGVVALVVLGPERLPEAARWLAGAIRKVKEFAGTAQQQLKDDFGTDFEDFREPLKQINDLRGMSPRALVTKHLLDGDDSLFTGDFDAAAPAGGAAATGAGGAPVQGTPSTGPVRSTPPTGPASAATVSPSAVPQAAPTQSAPTQSAPTQAAPTQSAPTQSAPTQSAPTQGSPSAPTWDIDAT